jgi:hypothetical protein
MGTAVGIAFSTTGAVAIGAGSIASCFTVAQLNY